MGVYKEILSGLRESYEKVRRLIDEQSRHDPEDEPYQSRYAARRVLVDMKAALESASPGLPRRAPLLAVVELNLGCVAVDTDELDDGDRLLEACRASLRGRELDADCVLTALAALNQLGVLWSHRGDAARSRDHLERAEALYEEFAATGVRAVEPRELFDDEAPPAEGRPDSSAKSTLERTHTLTLYYLAQIYGALDDHLKSAVYCHITLRRQLLDDDDEEGSSGADRWDPVEWALNAATLAQFFVDKGGFMQARHHLAAASYALDRRERQLARLGAGEDADGREQLERRSADVARCWAKYGLSLLATSRDRLLHHADDADDDSMMSCSLSSDIARLKLSENSSVSAADLRQLSFPSLNLSLYENQITYKFILTFDDAKAVFHVTKEWIDKAASYYTMENLASDHLQIMQDASQLYKLLAFFEDSEERQAKMHKRRIDILEKAIQDLNPTYYMSYLRQIWYELGETYQEILNIKMERTKASDERPSPHVLNKINKCAEQSIKYYTNFVNSLKPPMSDELPKKFTPETEKAALGAFFQIGSLYTKIIVLDKQAQIRNTEETLKAYKNLVDYCDNNAEAGQALKTEFGICKEMVDLLPFKIQKLKRESNIP